jgi:hypothetical protein
VAFKKAQDVAPSLESPLALFADLPRMPGSVPNLWGPQTAVLNEYIKHHVDIDNHRNHNLPNAPFGDSAG